MAAVTNARAWMPGIERAYNLFYYDERGARGPGEDIARPARISSLQGELRVAVVGLREGEVDLRASVRAQAYFESSRGSGLHPESFITQLQATVYVLLDARGAALVTYFEPGLEPWKRDILRSIVAASQFVRPEVIGETWRTQELDVTGVYAARYQHHPSVHPYRKYQRTKEYYLRLSRPDGLHPLAASVQVSLNARTDFYLGEDTWPELVEAREYRAMTSTVGEVPPSAQKHSMTLSRVSSRRAPELIGSLELQRPRLDAVPLSTRVLVPGG
ncbi:hypothetical protein [Myxococcus sp. CA040A]|uniref:hypothetical protein n=1 Tax=Myxococcus sp. CA040A TaxID=2741738 RepID=UPI00157A7F39|nr:hypothetical protein [Myxococcus sp. CA040A]NTX06753.1 hypothetical protein [Myxococcus sp. CA040A]